jgi:hypothetical protein
MRRIVPVAAALVMLGASGCFGGDHRTTTAAPTFGLTRPHDYNDFCGGGECAPHGLVPVTLRRIMHLPRLAAGAGCPVSRSRVVSSQFGPALGAGPAYPVGLGGGVLQITPPSRGTVFAGSGWGGNKVLWVIAPLYRGPVLVRGGRIDQLGGMGFDAGNTYTRSYSELDLPPAASGGHGWRGAPSHTRVRAPGCYAYQIDGTDFSRVVVFRATSPIHG